MPKIDEIMKRMRHLTGSKPTKEVIANGKVEVMTTTQAYRFNELQELGYADDLPPDLPKKAVYELQEAAERLRIGVEDILGLAASGKLLCHVSAAGLSGNWEPAAGQPAKTDARPAFLSLTPAACAEIRDFGSANVTELQHRRPDGTFLRFRLRDTQWLDANRLLMLHPLPKLN